MSRREAPRGGGCMNPDPMQRTRLLTKSAHELAADGRVRRSQRSGQAIVDALLDLVGQGILSPTAHQVAARAGVGIRTVFRRFSDMESLFAEMDVRLHADAVPLLISGQPHGSLRTRALELVRRRVAFFEHIAPYKRSGNVKRWRSPFLRNGHARLVRVLRAELVRWLPEVERAPSAVADALELATSFEAWDRLRAEQALGSARAQAALEQTVLLLIKELRK
jgi:AcrR family transcriptional regulator